MEEILRDLNHTLGVYGEGEYAFAAILRKLEKGEDPRTLDKGICFELAKVFRREVDVASFG